MAMRTFVGRRNIGNRLTEDVGTFLIQQRGSVACPLGLFVESPSIFARLDLSLDDARADGHGHRVDRGIVRKRENVDRLDWLLERVVVELDDVDASHHAADFGLDGGVLQGTISEYLSLRTGAEQSLSHRL